MSCPDRRRRRFQLRFDWHSKALQKALGQVPTRELSEVWRHQCDPFPLIVMDIEGLYKLDTIIWCYMVINYWLVVSTPLKKNSQLGWLFPEYMEKQSKCSKPPTRLYWCVQKQRIPKNGNLNTSSMGKLIIRPGPPGRVLAEGVSLLSVGERGRAPCRRPLPPAKKRPVLRCFVLFPFFAIFRSLWLKMGQHAPTWTSRCPQDGPTWPPRWASIAPSWANMAPRWANIAPRWANTAPRWANIATRWAHIARKIGQHRPT